jgi:hypothetical protein
MLRNAGNYRSCRSKNRKPADISEVFAACLNHDAIGVSRSFGETFDQLHISLSGHLTKCRAPLQIVTASMLRLLRAKQGQLKK